MSSDQIAEISPLIREVFDHAREHPAQDEVLCATFEIVGVDNAWAQVTPTELNVAYPSDRSPEDELGEIIRRLPAAELVAWEPTKFATWSFVSERPGEVAEVVDLILARLFYPGDYSVDGQLERL
jgi:hypothetical protein